MEARHHLIRAHSDLWRRIMKLHSGAAEAPASDDGNKSTLDNGLAIADKFKPIGGTHAHCLQDADLSS